jgi:hypothetical protein
VRSKTEKNHVPARQRQHDPEFECEHDPADFDGFGCVFVPIRTMNYRMDTTEPRVKVEEAAVREWMQYPRGAPYDGRPPAPAALPPGLVYASAE